jgi:hypothetical protein
LSNVRDNPDRNVLTASHSSELAERWGRKTRNLIASHGGDLGVTLSEDSAAAYRWATTEGGEYLAVGVGVGIAGFRADLGIIDDPFGSREDAESRRIRDRVWDWYSDDFSTLPIDAIPRHLLAGVAASTPPPCHLPALALGRASRPSGHSGCRDGGKAPLS